MKIKIGIIFFTFILSVVIFNLKDFEYFHDNNQKENLEKKETFSELRKGNEVINTVKESSIKEEVNSDDRSINDEVFRVTDTKIEANQYSDKELEAEIDYIRNLIESEIIIDKINQNSLNSEEREQVKKLFSLHDSLSLEKTRRLVKEIEEEYDDKFFLEMEESLKDLKKDIQDTKEQITNYSNS